MPRMEFSATPSFSLTFTANLARMRSVATKLRYGTTERERKRLEPQLGVVAAARERRKVEPETVGLLDALDEKYWQKMPPGVWGICVEPVNHPAVFARFYCFVEI